MDKLAEGLTLEMLPEGLYRMIAEAIGTDTVSYTHLLARKRLSGDPRNPFRPRYGAELTFTAAAQEVTAATWPEHCEGRSLRCFRSYSLRQGDQLLALGRTQWAVPVSYTHLDVYKRQAFSDSDISRR